MTLDLLQVAPQVGAMAREAGARHRALARRRELAVALLRQWAGRLDELRALVQQEQTWTRMIAEPLEPLLSAHPAPALPPDVTVVATDGSSIDLDRHGLAQCYLLNVGAAVIRYGEQPDAALTSRAALYYRDEDLYLDEGARVPVQGALVDLKRTLAEQARALDLVRALSGHGQIVAVADGTLLLWQLSGRAAEETYIAAAIAGYAAGLREFQRLGVPVCSYVSRPNGHEVVNLLQLAADRPSPPHPLSLSAGEGEHGVSACAGEREHGVSACAGEGKHGLAAARRRETSPYGMEGEAPLPDRALMGHLRRGERSARFASRSPVLRHYGEGAGVQFFYLNVGDEIARVEVPTWVGDDATTLDLVHATIFDGCARGWGYPPALAEAHEQAVIRGGEREAFMRMVMEALNAEDQPAGVSLKRLSKNRRAV